MFLFLLLVLSSDDGSLPLPLMSLNSTQLNSTTCVNYLWLMYLFFTLSSN
jgi:hypothetical protein